MQEVFGAVVGDIVDFPGRSTGGGIGPFARPRRIALRRVID